MKKRAIVLFIAILIVAQFISAVELEIKSSYNSGETLLGKITGTFLTSLSKDNIYFYKNNVKIPVIFDITKINEDYYLYALLPEIDYQDNYSVVIRNAEYYKGSKIVKEDIKRNFTISDKVADFSIKPGFVITQNGFSLFVQNLQESKITIKIESSSSASSSSSSSNPSQEVNDSFFDFLIPPSSSDSSSSSSSNEQISEEINLISGEIKELEFSAGSSNRILKFLKLSSTNTNYQIPILILANQSYIPLPPNTSILEFMPSFFNVIMSNITASRTIYLNNSGTEKIKNISLIISNSLKDYISINPNNISELDANDKINLTIILTPKDKTEYLEGHILAKTDSLNVYLPIVLNITKNFVPPVNNGGDKDNQVVIIGTQTCSQMSGKFCKSNEQCSITLVDSFDGKCCLGNCQPQKSSPWGKLLGWGLLIVVIALIAWFFLKYKKTKRASRF